MHKFIPSAMSWLNWLEQDQIRHSESWKWHIKRNAVTMWVVTTCTSHTECILNTVIWHGNCELNRRSNPILKWCYPYPNSICQTWKTQNTHWNYLCSITRVLPTTRQNGTSVDWAPWLAWTSWAELYDPRLCIWGVGMFQRTDPERCFGNDPVSILRLKKKKSIGIIPDEQWSALESQYMAAFNPFE